MLVQGVGGDEGGDLLGQTADWTIQVTVILTICTTSLMMAGPMVTKLETAGCCRWKCMKPMMVMTSKMMSTRKTSCTSLVVTR